MSRSRLMLFVVVLIFAGCRERQKPFNPEHLSTEWALVRNITTEKPQFRASITIVNNGETTLPPEGWKLYFSLRYHGYQLVSQSTEIELQHVSGDLFYLNPTVNFSGLKAGQSITMDYTGNKRIANFQDVPSGLFWVSQEDSTQALKLEPPVIAFDQSMEKLPEADGAAIFEKNKMINDIPIEKLSRVFPTPVKLVDVPEVFYLNKNTTIGTDDAFTNEAKYLGDELEKVMTSKPATRPISEYTAIEFRRTSLPPENYHLSVKKNKVLIEAADGAGAFYAIQSLKIMMPPLSWKAKADSIKIGGIDVTDGPRFPFRAFMLDVGRNFQTKNQILETLELMSLYKLNIFHFHLTDDEGWRIEIPGLPELTSIGATRGFPFGTNDQLHPSYGSGPGHQDSGTGYYTADDYVEIVKYAATRHIRVIPEIESPGHARAAIKAMQKRRELLLSKGDPIEANRYTLHDVDDKSTYTSNQYFTDNVMNVALPSTYAFIEKVIDELISMHNKAGAPLTAIHMAGDEVPFGSWEKSPAVAQFMKSHPDMHNTKDVWKYYFKEIKKILLKKKLSMYGWQELVVGTQTEGDSKHIVQPEYVSDNLQVDAWWNMQGNEDVPYQLANAGYKTVLTCFDHLYFDLAYASGFNEPGDAWIGFLDIDRIFGFIPYDYYRNFKTNVRGELHSANFFEGKVKLLENARANIRGIQGALWSENMISGELMQYMLVPRLLALGERAWAKDPAWATESNDARAAKLYSQAWSQFTNVLGKRELPRLDFYPGKIRYRIPTPGAIVAQHNVIANVQLPGLQIRYTSDGSEPNEGSTLYTEPIKDKTIIRLRAFDQRGRGSLPVTIINK